MPQIQNGQGLDIAVPPGQSIAISSISGTYSASLLYGTKDTLATNSDGGATFGPYASGNTVRLTAGASSVIAYDVGSSPSAQSALVPTYATDSAGNVTGLVGPDGGAVNPNGFMTLYTGRQYFFGFGDSITADGGRVIDANGTPEVNVYQYNWPRYAELASGGCAQWGGSFAQASYTIPQLRSEWLPRLLKFAPANSVVVVLMGQNNSGVTDAELTDYTYCIDAMMGSGLIPVLCLQTAGTGSRARMRLHNHVMKLAFTRNLHVADLHAATIDPSTGILNASLSRDTVHPNQAGSKALGDVVGAVLQKIYPRKTSDFFLAKHALDYGPNRTTQSGGTTNPLFQTSNAGSPDVPSGWSILAGSHASAFSYAAVTYGRSCSINAPASGEMIVRNSSANTVVAGDKCVLSCVMTQTVASSGYVRFAIMNGGGTAIYDAGRNHAQGGGVSFARSPLVVPFTHSGSSGVLFDVVVNGAGSALVLEQFSIVNLTALGLA